MINIIWFILIFLGIVYSFLTGNVSIINKELLESSTQTLDMVLKMFPIMALWLGIMAIAEKSGLLKKFSTLLSKIINPLFPTIPKNHESLSYISTNIIANMFGLGSVATPFGLKAMQSLQTLNKKKDTASNAMITFLVLNTSGVTLIPTTILSLRMLYNSENPTMVLLPIIIVTTIGTTIGLLTDYIIRRKNE